MDGLQQEVFQVTVAWHVWGQDRSKSACRGRNILSDNLQRVSRNINGTVCPDKKKKKKTHGEANNKTRILKEKK